MIYIFYGQKKDIVEGLKNKITRKKYFIRNSMQKKIFISDPKHNLLIYQGSEIYLT